MRNSAHGKGHEEEGSALRKGRIEPQETSCSQASAPKTRVCLLYCFMLSPIPLTLWGLSPTTSLREGVNLQLQSIKIPGCDKSVSTYKLLWRISTLPEQVRPATCDFLQPSHHERHEVFFNFLKTDSLGKLEITSIVGWLGIILVKGFSFIGPMFVAKSPALIHVNEYMTSI